MHISKSILAIYYNYSLHNNRCQNIGGLERFINVSKLIA